MDFLQEITGYTFSKRQKQLILIAFFAILPGIGFLAFMFRAQIFEIITYGQNLLGNMNGAVLVIVAIVGNVLSGVFLLLLRKHISKKCPSCGRYQSIRANYCMQCGTKIPRKHSESST